MHSALHLRNENLFSEIIAQQIRDTRAKLSCLLPERQQATCAKEMGIT